MPNVPEHVSVKVKAKILSDLKPDLTEIFWKVGFSLAVGGWLTMIFCGQFGIGASSFAVKFNEHLHHQSGILCAVVCGVLFSVIPVVVLRFLSTAHKFQAMIRYQAWVTAVWMVAIAALLSYFGDMGTEFFYVSVWFVAALTTYRLGGLIFHLSERKFNRLTEF